MPRAALTWTVGDIVTSWRPDHHNLNRLSDVTWPQAVDILYAEDAAKQRAIEALVLRHGVGFGTIVLRADGVLDDGHHRIAAAVRHNLLDQVVSASLIRML